MNRNNTHSHLHKFFNSGTSIFCSSTQFLRSRSASLFCLSLFVIFITLGNAKADIINSQYTNPPILSKYHVNWWRHHGSPKPITGWKYLDSVVKSTIPGLNQLANQQGKLVFLLNLKVGKRGKLQFLEIFDSNLPDTSLYSELASVLLKIPFAPYISSKGKIITKNCLVMMELSANISSSEGMQNDTLIPNKEIINARFLGGEDLFLRYVVDEFEYPNRCQDAGINGYVLIRFMVDRNGYVSRCQILQGSSNCPEFGKEAIRIFYLCPQWIPATHNGKNINAFFQISISLRIN